MRCRGPCRLTRTCPPGGASTEEGVCREVPGAAVASAKGASESAEVTERTCGSQGGAGWGAPVPVPEQAPGLGSRAPPLGSCAAPAGRVALLALASAAAQVGAPAAADGCHECCSLYPQKSCRSLPLLLSLTHCFPEGGARSLQKRKMPGTYLVHGLSMN